MVLLGGLYKFRPERDLKLRIKDNIVKREDISAREAVHRSMPVGLLLGTFYKDDQIC